MKRNFMVILPVCFYILLSATASAHCDTMDGPVVADAKIALEKNNVNYILKWVKPAAEKETRQVFELVMKVRVLNDDAKQLADMHLFETVVRLHRTGEGESFTGLKPSGTPIDEKIMAADKSIASGDLSPLEKIVPEEKMAELKKRFARVMALKNFKTDDVAAGREYVGSYVQFFHFAEGEGDHEKIHEN